MTLNKNSEEKLMFSVGSQLNLIFIIIFVILAIFFSTTQFKFGYYTNSVAYHINQSSKIVELKKEFTNCEISLENYLLSGNRQQLSKFNDSVDFSKKIISELNNSGLSNENYFLLKSIETAFNNYFLEGCQASFNYNTKNYEYFSKMYSAEIIQNYLQKYCDELLTSVLQSEKESNEILDKSVKSIMIFSFVFFLSFLVMLVLIMIYIFKNITHPLRLLVNQARAVSKGNFDVRVSTLKNNNSMALLINTFNDMNTSIKRMLEQLKEKALFEKELIEEQKKNEENQKLLNEARFLALQSQTNPHFLFNTLNTISRMITLEKNDDSLEMLESLSIMLRYNLSIDERYVPLFRELEVTMEYIAIQKKRFGKRLNFEINVDKDLAATIELPKFTLQPLVENAIVHGLEPLEQGGTIFIGTIVDDDNVSIYIHDDGKGINSETLAKLREGKAIKKDDRNHLGFNNTKSRLELYMKEKDVLLIDSEENNGTTVIIKILNSQRRK